MQPLPDPLSSGVTIVVRTPAGGAREPVARWLHRVGETAATFPGFLDQAVLPPNPPEQPHWVTLQWFARPDDATAWLSSPQRHEVLAAAPANVPEPDDIHIVARDRAAGDSPEVSAIFTTRVRPGREAAYRAWQRRVAAALGQSTGFRGYRFEAPVPTVQDAYLVVARFASDADLRVWLGSPVRLALLEEAKAFTDGVSVRVAGAGLDRWFGMTAPGGQRAEWKMSLLVLLVLYPTVSLFDRVVGKPVFAANGVPGWLAMFLGNVACVTALAWLVPFAGGRFRWWLDDWGGPRGRTFWLGLGAVMGGYAASMAAFAALAYFAPER